MISLKPITIERETILENLKNLGLASTKLESNMRSSFLLYALSGGNPNLLTPIAVTPEQKELLLQGYKFGYVRRVDDIYLSNWIYDLRNGDSLPYCPMCGNTGRDAIDHYLPESTFPEFAFFNLNLVPTCTSCNGKRNKHANAPGVKFSLLHPYMDGDVLNKELVAIRIEGIKDEFGNISYIIPKFELVPWIGSEDPLYERLKNHISKCVKKEHVIRWVKGRWGVWKNKAYRYKTISSLRKAIQREMIAEIDIGGNNNWTVAFLRGLSSDVPAMEWLKNNP